MKTKSDKHVAVQIEECYGERQDMDCLFVEGEHVNGSVSLTNMFSTLTIISIEYLTIV